jgi:UDP-N-acetylmuramoyl-tripeptide--D-alanyl-D-alanine ligase
VRRSVHEAAAAMAGEVISGDGRREWEGAVLDSRQVHGGELFFALPGAKSDGHLHAGEALAGGAAAAVVARRVEAPAGSTLVRVADTYLALHALTRWARRQVPRRLVGITGSTGKTTTKELLAAMLATRFRVAKSPGNLNNLYGFPVALLGVPDGCDWMVAEMGMSTPGELREISLLGRPDVALYTNVRPVHLEFFASLRAIAEAKAGLLAGLAADGLVVANADDPEVARIARRHAEAGGRVAWYGMREPAAVTAAAVEEAPGGEVGTRFRLRAAGEEVEVRLPLHGRYNVENFLAAAACAHALGVPLGSIAGSAAAARPAPLRGVVERLAGGAILVDDSYNSNPVALSEALRGAAALPARRRWAVLGEMRELGPETPAFHHAAGEEAARLGFSPVAAVGELARGLAAGVAAAGGESTWLPDAAAAASWAAGELRPGDLVLVKGSRGVGLERVSDALRARGERPGRPGAGGGEGGGA